MTEPTKGQVTESKIKPEDIIMPSNSSWPILLALGITIILAGLAISWPFIIVGLLVTLVSAIGWTIEPAHEG